MAATRIVIFAKAPLPGRVKTRLVPVLGEVGAAALAARMLAATVAQAIASGLAVELCGAPDPHGPEWAGQVPPGVMLSDQGDGDLGARMVRAAARVTGGGERVLLIGSDCPALDASRLRAAAAALDEHDAVIFPAHDGGYVLLGLRRSDAALFDAMAWSTDRVAAETIARIAALGWSLFVGETLRDVDEPADLAFVTL